MLPAHKFIFYDTRLINTVNKYFNAIKQYFHTFLIKTEVVIYIQFSLVEFSARINPLMFVKSYIIISSFEKLNFVGISKINIAYVFCC